MTKYALIVGKLPASRKEVRSLLTNTSGNLVPMWAKDKKTAHKDPANVEVIITADHKVTGASLAPWPNVKMLSLAFTGYDDVDRGYCEENGLYVYCVPDYSKPSVSEVVLLLTLAIFRNLVKANKNTRTGRFDRGSVQPGTELEGKTVGIIGTGRIGTHTARKFLGLGCKVIGWNRTDKPEFLELGSKFACLGSDYADCLSCSTDLAEVLSRADIVTLHLATEDETKHFVDRTFLRLMRPGAILINTARARLVKTADLIDALQDGHLRGAGIDVYDQEPLPKKAECRHETTRTLLSMPQVVLTPHLGFKTHESLRRLVKETFANVGRYARRVQGDDSADSRKNCLFPGTWRA